MSGGADPVPSMDEGSGDIPKRIPARRGFSISYKGLTLLSNIDPVTQAERSVDAIPMQERTLYFCPSPLLGYGLERLLARISAEAPNSALLCIEADENLFNLSEENFSVTLKADTRLKLCGLTEPAALCAFVRQTWGGRQFRRVTPVRLGGGWRLYSELYDSLENVLRRDIAQDWSNALTLARLGRLYMRNSLRNLALIPRCPPVTDFSFGGTQGDMPVLLLGAGPSLDSLLDGLVQKFGSVLTTPARPFRVVCVDTALGALKARNIKPDLAVVLESQYWNLRDFIGLGDWVIPSALDISALPASARLQCLTPMLFFTPWVPLRIFSRLKQQGLLPPVFPPLGSVGLSAAAITLRISTGPVVACGLDFSFTPDAYHARSTPGHRDKLRTHSRFQTFLNTAAFDEGSFGTVSKSGVQVYSNPVMRNYRDLFEQEFSRESRLFDVSGTGLPLGIKTLSPDQCFDLLEAGGTTGNMSSNVEERTPILQENLVATKLADFAQSEKDRLNNLRDILSGGADATCLDQLIDECDYLWAHFPDYAGGLRPNAQAISVGTPQALSFLKRLRAEIEPALTIFEKLQTVTISC